MRKATILFTFFLAVGLRAMAQGGDVDVTVLKADQRTQLFSDGKHTVQGYVYSQLEKSTSCCGNDGIFMEVIINKEGYVVSTKAMTGKNECHKKSVCEILKNVRWDAAGVQDKKTLYFEIKPVVPCSGSPGENTFKPIAITNNPNFNSGEVAVNTVTEEAVEEEVVEEVVEEVKTPVNEEVSNEESNSEEESSEETSEVIAKVPVVEEVKKNEVKEEAFLSDQETSNATRNNEEKAPVASVKKASGGGTLPAQDKKEYVSPGERNPDASHKETHLNETPGTVNEAKYQVGDNELAIRIKKELRKTGYCGFAQAAIELTVDPAGNIVNNRVMYSNNEKINSALPSILSGIKFVSKPVRYNYITIVQFKTEMICDGKSTIDLNKMPNVLETGNK